MIAPSAIAPKQDNPMTGSPYPLPEAMTQFIHCCKDRGVRAEELLELLRLVLDQPLSHQPPGVSPRFPCENRTLTRDG